jgi:sensor histidine kinase YesM
MKKKLLAKIHINWTMRRAVLTLTVVSVMIAMVAMTIVFSVASRRQISRENLSNNDETLERMEEELDSYLHELTVKMQTIYTETEMISAMREWSEEDLRLPKYYWSAWKLSSKRFDTDDRLLAMYIYDDVDSLVSSWRDQPYNYPYDLYTTNEYVNVSTLQKYVASDSFDYLISGYHNDASGKDVLRLVLKLHTYDEERTQFGYLVCDFDSLNIESLMKKYISEGEVYAWLQPVGDEDVASVGNTTQEGTGIYEKIVETVSGSEEFPVLSNEYGDFYQNHRTFENFKLSVVMLTPMSLVFSTQSTLMKSLALIAVITMCIVILISSLISKILSRPLEEMSKTVKRIRKGETGLRVKTDGWSEEIAVLGSEFNKLLDRIQKMMQDEYESKMLVERTKFKALQAQINPHFLYNTLDSMSGIASAQNCPLVSGLCQSLSAIFRYSLNISDDFSDMQKEMAHVRNYLYVMDVRNGNSVSYEYHIDPETLEDSIPRISLQPIVENALQHGLRNSRRKDKKLSMSAVHSADKLIITIEDNGIGMDAKAMNEKLEDADIKRVEMGRSIGVLNVNARLKSAFGKEYGIHYESTLGEGTKAIMTLPIERRKENAS